MAAETVAEAITLMENWRSATERFAGQHTVQAPTHSDIDNLIANLKVGSNSALDKIGEKLKSKMRDPDFQNFVSKVAAILSGVGKIFGDALKKVGIAAFGHTPFTRTEEKIENILGKSVVNLFERNSKLNIGSFHTKSTRASQLKS